MWCWENLWGKARWKAHPLQESWPIQFKFGWHSFSTTLPRRVILHLWLFTPRNSYGISLKGNKYTFPEWYPTESRISEFTTKTCFFFSRGALRVNTNSFHFMTSGRGCSRVWCLHVRYARLDLLCHHIFPTWKVSQEILGSCYRGCTSRIDSSSFKEFVLWCRVFLLFGNNVMALVGMTNLRQSVIASYSFIIMWMGMMFLTPGQQKLLMP